MSDMSYPSKETNKFMNVQGGDKKVMKKILSVALSTAMAFSMFATVASANTAATPQQAFDALQAKGILQGFPDGQAHLDKDLTRAEFAIIIAKLADLEGVAGTSFRDANYANHWAKAEIEAVYKAGFMQGVGANLFQPSAKVTLQEVATVVSRILKLETPTAVNNNAALWAQGYVQSVINAGLISPAGLDFTAAANRGTVVSLVYAVDQVQSVPVLSNAVVVDASTLTVTLSDGTTHQVKLATPLVANTATNVTFEINGQSYTTSVTYVVESATKVQSVSANNLKEVIVTYDGNVNKASAEALTSYVIKDSADATQNILSAALQSDNKTVVLTLTGRLQNQTDYKLSVRNVRGASSTTANVATTDFQFRPVDAALPTVTAVEGLGNRAVKLTFSEPVQATATVAATFKIDGNAVSGTVSGNGTRELVVEFYNNLTPGAHTLSIGNQIQDFAGYSLIALDQQFTVVEDTTAPTLVEAKDVTLESVTLVFSEEVREAQAVLASNYHWLSGTAKRTPDSVTRIDGKTVRLSFSGINRLPAVATDIFVANVSDYSNNVVAANTKITVNPVVDQTRPEVVTENFNGTETLTLTFNKPVDPASFNVTNAVLKNNAGTAITTYGITAAVSGNVVTVTFSRALDAGSYTFELSGLRDTTTLGNTMMPYSTSLVAQDQTAPTADSIAGSNNVYYVTFSAAMDTSTTASILSLENYIVTYTNAAGNSITGRAPAGTNLTPINGNKGVIITLPNSVQGVTSLTVQGVKSASGVFLSGYSKTFNTGDIQGTIAAQRALATAKDTVLVKFNQPITVNSFAHITVDGNPVSNAVVDPADNTVVRLSLSTTNAFSSTQPTGNVEIPAGAISNLSGAANALVDTAVLDGIAPVLDTINVVGGTNVVVAFEEAVSVKNPANLINNFAVYKANGEKFTYGTDFTASLNGDGQIVLDLSASDYAGRIAVVFTNDNGNVVDAAAVKLDGTANTSLSAASFDTRVAGTITGFIEVDAD
jgi:trimeric autotransporter adhesin